MVAATTTLRAGNHDNFFQTMNHLDMVGSPGGNSCNSSTDPVFVLKAASESTPQPGQGLLDYPSKNVSADQYPEGDHGCDEDETELEVEDDEDEEEEGPSPSKNRASQRADNAGPNDWQNIAVPGPHDVLLGRGGGTNNHSGNIKFRKLVNEHKFRYLACSKVDKPKVARDVVDLWRQMDPPGRFLARQDETRKGPGSVKNTDNVWYEVGDKKAREKASQCLRERTPEVMPYIKQLREHQDAFTEQGVSMVQHQMQLVQQQQQQQHQQQMAAAVAARSAHGNMFGSSNSNLVAHHDPSALDYNNLPPSPAEYNNNRLMGPPSMFPRRNSLPLSPDRNNSSHHGSFHHSNSGPVTVFTSPTSSTTSSNHPLGTPASGNGGGVGMPLRRTSAPQLPGPPLASSTASPRRTTASERATPSASTTAAGGFPTVSSSSPFGNSTTATLMREQQQDAYYDLASPTSHRGTAALGVHGPMGPFTSPHHPAYGGGMMSMMPNAHPNGMIMSSNEEALYEELSDLEYEQYMLMQQQQLQLQHAAWQRMRQNRLRQRQQQQRMGAASLNSSGHDRTMLGDVPSHNQNYVDDSVDPMMMMSHSRLGLRGDGGGGGSNHTIGNDRNGAAATAHNNNDRDYHHHTELSDRRHSDHSGNSESSGRRMPPSHGLTAGARPNINTNKRSLKPDEVASKELVDGSDALIGINSRVFHENGELSIEEYRQQLEEYMQRQDKAAIGGAEGATSTMDENNVDEPGSNHRYKKIQYHNARNERRGGGSAYRDMFDHATGNGGGGGHEDSDMEDDWEKERERARLQENRKRGVGRNASAMSYMTDKSNMSLVSGLSALSAEMSFREEKMNMARSVGSNLSLMSDMTDLSENIDNLSILDD